MRRKKTSKIATDAYSYGDDAAAAAQEGWMGGEGGAIYFENFGVKQISKILTENKTWLAIT